ncbi:MAG: dTDP-4-dehydrorhamnose reductase [Thermobacillus sp.]|uniref:dTDP-4-dehydrorhamnose reductase n=1 Tax=Thermobacillus sp. TaxID=2108467 RepID=UPI000E3A4973|nr:dTDP-4-dehydrorhamnose reductase [Thermobacillus sp.]REK55521.1 MAG: dTDP-4-dehydrorhamnose reductase [Thermobacillus sp.]
MKILVTGANGQLGRELAWLQAPQNMEIIGFGRGEMDITNLAQCRSVIRAHRPDAVIHCAAYTKVDQAESEPDEAYRVNAYGTRNTALAAEEIGAKFVYVSTDYVFDGRADKPYREYDRTDPQTVYGRSKLAGEQLVQSLSSRYFIVRTSWVYGKYGANFVKTMLKLAEDRDRLKVVHDQVGSPTYTLDLARFLLDLVKTDYYGIYHASNSGTCSWYEFAKAIFEERGLNVEVEPCTTAEFPRPAPRPAYSVLDHGAIRVHGLAPLRSWREALRHYLQNCE